MRPATPKSFQGNCFMRPGAMKTGGEIEMGARLDRSFGVEIWFRAGGFCAPAGQDRTARAWVFRISVFGLRISLAGAQQSLINVLSLATWEKISSRATSATQDTLRRAGSELLTDHRLC